ncbi:hypothetical protein Ga0466249_005032 [Sporomusaceae bacterium BoRhaA]|nr:hypothetical protein [Pelorhabdus rhamnosifermentans]
MFTVSSSDPAATLSAVKNGGSVVNATNYIYASGALTIKKEYLTTLTNGAKTISIVMTSGSDMTVTITVGD